MMCLVFFITRIELTIIVIIVIFVHDNNRIAKYQYRPSLLWIRSIQRNSFPEENKQLQKGKTVTYKGQFQLFLSDQKFICCKGHLGTANLPETMKYPVLLPTKHYFTEL